MAGARAYIAFQMKRLFFVWLFGLSVIVGSAQSANPNQVAKGFSSVTYFEAPHEQQIKIRMTGSEIIPQSFSLFDVRKLKIEQFNVDGSLMMTVEIPQCFYNSDTGTVNSAGNVSMNSSRIRIEGNGFLWNQRKSSMVISNKVRTVIKL